MYKPTIALHSVLARFTWFDPLDAVERVDDCLHLPGVDSAVVVHVVQLEGPLQLVLVW